MIVIARACARAWVRLYTRGLALPVRDRRRAEIECDLWEHRHGDRSRDRHPLVTAVGVLGRTLRGVPSDVAWRWQQRARGRAASLWAGARWVVFPALVELGYLTGAARI